jgi:hypothetical protein
MQDYTCLKKIAGIPGSENDNRESRDRGSRFHDILLSLPVAGLLLLLVLHAGCNCEDTRLSSWVYRYDREGESGGKNLLPVFVSNVIQYIFDENEWLVAIDTVWPDGAGKFVSWRHLSPGRYAVSGWGNVNGTSRVRKTTTGQVELYLDNETGTGVQGASERLFYGYREFTVGEQGENRVHVDMTHAHCVLTFAIWWKNAAMTPAATGDFHLVLRDVPSQYGFFPGYRTREMLASPYSPGMEGYPAGDGTVINYIPVVHDKEQLVTCREVAGMNSKTLRGEVVTYRLSSDSHPVLSIHGGEGLLEREIDLHEFFTSLGIRLDETLRQEYQIGLEIESDRVVAFLMNASLNDWNDGKL